MKHLVPDEWMKRTLLSDIDSSPQFFFEIGQQATREPRRRKRTRLYQ